LTFRATGSINDQPPVRDFAVSLTGCSPVQSSRGRPAEIAEMPVIRETLGNRASDGGSRRPAQMAEITLWLCRKSPRLADRRSQRRGTEQFSDSKGWPRNGRYNSTSNLSRSLSRIPSPCDSGINTPAVRRFAWLGPSPRKDASLEAQTWPNPLRTCSRCWRPLGQRGSE
jgi:hypothetical protein